MGQSIVNLLRNPLLGSPIYHYQAKLVAPGNYNEVGRPEYLAPDPGIYDSGIQYTPNPSNPLRGVFCQAPRQPIQEPAGIYYQGQFEIYLTGDPGDVFLLDEKYPKRQDRFTVFGRNYYAVAPAVPCQMGEVVAAWKISLAIERYPVPR